MMRISVMVLALITGDAGLLAFGAHLWRGSLDAVDLLLGPGVALVANGAISLVFFLQHSGMVRQRFRLVLQRFVPADYTIASGVALVAVAGLWQRVDIISVSAAGAVRWALRALFVAAGGGMVWGIIALGGSDLFGLRPLRAGTQAARPFTVRDPYCWVRHPLYTLTLVMIWSCPELTLDRLLFNLLWSGWILLACRWEERDLVDYFGQTHRFYQERVPMLFPWHHPTRG